MWMVAAMAFLFPRCGSRDSQRRLLAVGGIHAFDKPCILTHVEPEGAVQNLNWPDAVVVEATREAVAEIVCGAVKSNVEFMVPARLDIETIGGHTPAEIKAHAPFKVQARLFNREGRELEVGKFTNIQWVGSGVLEVANDPSAGEFGICDTCYGMFGFRATGPGEGEIEARLGELRGTLKIRVRS
jgi:hypothetical protein